MIKFLFAAAALTVTAAPALATPDYIHFEQDGAKYRYTVTRQGDAQLIRGTERLSGKRFNLRVAANGQVSGIYGGQRLRFTAEPVAPARLASR